MSDKLCFLCHLAIGNIMVGCSEGIAHEACYYKREADRPGDEVVQELRTQLRVMSRELRTQTPCIICAWPRPSDNFHNICECCGFQEGYDSSNYPWDGQWWSVNDDKPKIVKRMLAEITELKSALAANEKPA